MEFSSRLIPGVLIRRYKRFLADIRLRNGRIVTAHCANTGSMLGCSDPGSPVYLSRNEGKRGRLAYTWEMIRVGESWVAINTYRANRLIAEAIAAGRVKELQGYARVRAEVPVHPGVRLDLCLERGGSLCFVEAKSVTLSIDGVAAFPDAVTERGRKHIEELIRLKKKGYRAVLFFVIQRGDCSSFRPADEIDGEYGLWLRRAVRAGVEVLPYRASVNPRGIRLTRRLPLTL